MKIAELKKLTTSERLQAMEALWESLQYENSVETPDWHERVLQERKDKIASGQAKFISLGELKNSRH